MTTAVDICNRALLSIGSQRIISSLTQDSVEAKACNTIYVNLRDDLLRMAPWDCALKTANLVYITSVPGTPENTSPATNLWQPGQPRPPWAYEYQYPIDCLRACWLIPSTQFGFAGGVPITTAVTGGASTLWNGAPIRFVIGIDSFYTVPAFTVFNGGTGNAVGDIITMDVQAPSFPSGPIGAPYKFTVTAVDVAGAVTAGIVINQVSGASTIMGGSYFTNDGTRNPNNSGSTTGKGTTGTYLATAFNGPSDQRVILTNQEFATLVYVRQVQDPNVWDPMFQDAFQQVLGARLAIILTGDKALANQAVSYANAKIIEARKVDGNEGLTINDVTPDWIRARGIWWSDNLQSGPYGGFDWGGLLAGY